MTKKSAELVYCLPHLSLSQRTAKNLVVTGQITLRRPEAVAEAIIASHSAELRRLAEAKNASLGFRNLRRMCLTWVKDAGISDAKLAGAFAEQFARDFGDSCRPVTYLRELFLNAFIEEEVA